MQANVIVRRRTPRRPAAGPTSTHHDGEVVGRVLDAHAQQDGAGVDGGGGAVHALGGLAEGHAVVADGHLRLQHPTEKRAAPTNAGGVRHGVEGKRARRLRGSAATSYCGGCRRLGGPSDAPLGVEAGQAGMRACQPCPSPPKLRTSEETRELTSAAGRGGQARGAATASRRFGGGSGGELRSTATASCRPARAPTRPAAQPNPRGAYLESRRPAETRLGRCLASTRPEHRWARTPGPGRPPGARHRPRMAAWWLAASAEERRGTRALRRRGWQPAIV